MGVDLSGRGKDEPIWICSHGNFQYLRFCTVELLSSLKRSQIVLVKHYKKITKEDMSVMQLEKDTSTKNLQKGI